MTFARNRGKEVIRERKLMNAGEKEEEQRLNEDILKLKLSKVSPAGIHPRPQDTHTHTFIT